MYITNQFITPTLTIKYIVIIYKIRGPRALKKWKESSAHYWLYSLSNKALTTVKLRTWVLTNRATQHKIITNNIHKTNSIPNNSITNIIQRTNINNPLLRKTKNICVILFNTLRFGNTTLFKQWPWPPLWQNLKPKHWLLASIMAFNSLFKILILAFISKDIHQFIPLMKSIFITILSL